MGQLQQKRYREIVADASYDNYGTIPVRLTMENSVK